MKEVLGKGINIWKKEEDEYVFKAKKADKDNLPRNGELTITNETQQAQLIIVRNIKGVWRGVWGGGGA